MEMSNQIKRYLYIFGIILFGIFCFYYSSKHEFTCDKWADNFKNNEKFHLVLKNKHNTGRDAYLLGIDIETKKNIEYYESSGWIESIMDSVKTGDTLLKDIGKYTITVKRRGRVFIIPFECDGKIYK